MGRPRKYEMSALDPFDESGVQPAVVWVEQAQVDVLTRANLTAKFFRLQLVKEVVEAPWVVFQGWERQEHEEDLCYVGRPDRDLPKEGVQTPPPPGMVFLVFVTKSGKVTDWRWEPADSDGPDRPENWRERFGRQVWPRNRATS